MSEPETVSAHPPVDPRAVQVTFRAIATGMVLGGVLSLTNIYTGLKIGWGFNMSVTAMLVSFGLYRGLERFGVRRWGMLENNINQTGASAAASISSAGLVAPIPALTILTGQELSYPLLVGWTFVVSLVGVMVAIGLRRQMLVQDPLPFPHGIASAETIKQMYAKGSEAMARVYALIGAAVVGATTKLTSYLLDWHPVGLPFSFAIGARRITFANLGFSVDPSVLMIGAGMIIGLRAGASMLLGLVIAWGVLAPMAVDSGWAVIPDALNQGDKLWFGPINKWMLWPGVSMMVTSALTSFAFSWRSVLASIRGTRPSGEDDVHDVPRRIFLGGLAFAGIAAVLGQVLLFDVTWWIAILAVALTFFLAVVAGRVAGETGLTPVGPMGKVTQLVFGVLSAENVAGNLMAANVTGGAASQCGDMLQDLKTGLLIGASPRHQALSQVFGVLAGALAGCAGYLVLVPDPAGMLLTEEWPAPAVAAWKGVAELFRDGIDGLPPMAPEAIAIGGGVGIVLAILEKVVPAARRKWVPSPSAVGIAIVVPGFYSISMFVGGVIAAVSHRVKPTWAARFVIILGAGLIAGESVAGVAIAIYRTITG
ncbi:MAG: OPT/YSL family transporter [Sandaracinaceae bacterium]|nr:OPT/YSL family transporter [Sandaracinaceae bacterium]